MNLLTHYSDLIEAGCDAFSNGAFVGGYSDHFPTYIVVSNK